MKLAALQTLIAAGESQRLLAESMHATDHWEMQPAIGCGNDPPRQCGGMKSWGKSRKEITSSSTPR